MLHRRQFSSGTAMLAIAACGPLRAQRGVRHVRVGYGGSFDPKDDPGAQLRLHAFYVEMARFGWHEGVNITYLFRFDGKIAERCQAIAQEFVDERVDLIVATYNGMAECSLQATSTIPIAAYTAGAIEAGYIKSLAKPGGNLSGVVELMEALTPKRMQLLLQAIPGASRIAYLGIDHEPLVKPALAAAKALGVRLTPVLVDNPEELARAIASTRGANAWLVDELVAGGQNRRELVDWIAASRLPAMYATLEMPRVGGLMSYAYDRVEGARDLARFADRMLRGAKPADLPAEQPTRYAFVFNSKTARTLGVRLPSSVLVQVTEVID